MVIDDTLPSDNPSRFRKNLLETIYNLIMKTDDKIKEEKLQYDNKRVTSKMSVWSSGKIDKYEYLTAKGILPSSDQSKIIEQAKFNYSPLGKAVAKQIQNDWRTRKKTSRCYDKSKQKTRDFI